MRKFKFLSILIVCVFAFTTVSYGDEKIHIPSNAESSTTVEQESAGVEISDIMIEGMEKAYDEELGAYVFTSKEASVMELEGSLEELIELVDYDVEKIETFESQPENRPDNYFEYQENDMSVLAATTTDLVAHGLAVNGEIKPGQKASFYYYITNYGSENLTNVDFEIRVNGKILGTLPMSGTVAANTQYRIGFNLNGLSAGQYDLVVNVDPNNIVAETNENNNSHAMTYEPNFCLHPWVSYLKETGDISVQVANSAFFGNVDMSIYEETLGAWNGITDKLEVVDATVTSSDDLLAGYNVLVQGKKLPAYVPSNTRAETIMKGVNQAPCTRIELYTNSSMATSNKVDNIRTIVHELGHVFNLQHPNDAGPSCSYKSMMYQSGYPLSTYEIQLHDQYGIYMLHEKGVKTLKVEPKTTEDSGEYQVFTRYPIEVYSLDELEDYAQYIVKGHILDEGQDMNVEGNQYTRTGFEISEVYKGDMEEGKTIYFKEPYYQEVVSGKNYTCYYNGYTKSIMDDEYIFFLIKDPDFEEYDVGFGPLARYNLSANDTIGEDVDNQSTKKVFTAENHSKIKEEVLLKYQ